MIVNHREDTPIKVGDYLRVPVAGTNLFGETLDYTNLSVQVLDVIATVESEMLSHCQPVWQTTIDGELCLDLQNNS